MSSAKLVKISHSHNNGFYITRLLPYLTQNYLLCVKYSFTYYFFIYSNFTIFSRSSLVLLNEEHNAIRRDKSLLQWRWFRVRGIFPCAGNGRS